MSQTGWLLLWLAALTAFGRCGCVGVGIQVSAEGLMRLWQHVLAGPATFSPAATGPLAVSMAAVSSALPFDATKSPLAPNRGIGVFPLWAGQSMVVAALGRDPSTHAGPPARFR